MRRFLGKDKFFSRELVKSSIVLCEQGELVFATLYEQCEHTDARVPYISGVPVQHGGVSTGLKLRLLKAATVLHIFQNILLTATPSHPPPVASPPLLPRVRSHQRVGNGSS